jgi:hypothetical protein
MEFAAGSGGSIHTIVIKNVLYYGSAAIVKKGVPA